MPAAIMTLPRTIIQNSVPTQVTSDPIDAISRKTVDAALAPNLSAITPDGICMAVYVQ